MQLLFVLETNSKAKTDYKYIRATYLHFYSDYCCKLTPIYAKCKQELIKQDKKIAKYVRDYKDTTEVIIVADYDRDNDPENQRIIEYCRKMNYHLVWMNRTIEEVYLGKILNNADKTKAADDFLKRNGTVFDNFAFIDAENPLKKRGTSNILVILNELLNEK